MPHFKKVISGISLILGILLSTISKAQTKSASIIVNCGDCGKRTVTIHISNAISYEPIILSEKMLDANGHAVIDIPIHSELLTTFRVDSTARFPIYVIPGKSYELKIKGSEVEYGGANSRMNYYLHTGLVIADSLENASNKMRVKLYDLTPAKRLRFSNSLKDPVRELNRTIKADSALTATERDILVKNNTDFVRYIVSTFEDRRSDLVYRDLRYKLNAGNGYPLISSPSCVLTRSLLNAIFTFTTSFWSNRLFLNYGCRSNSTLKCEKRNMVRALMMAWLGYKLPKILSKRNSHFRLKNFSWRKIYFFV